MGSRGPAPQPLAILKAKGTLNVTRTKDEVVEVGGFEWVNKDVPPPPDELDEVGINVWVSHLSEAVKVDGYLSKIDLNIFQDYCQVWSELKHLTDQCRGNSIMYEDYTGVKRINPIYKERDDKRKLMIKLAKEFGFTPSSRTQIRLSTSAAKEKVDEFDEVL